MPSGRASPALTRPSRTSSPPGSQNQEVLVNDKGEISEYRVQLKVTFILED